MKDFTYYNPTRLILGRGRIARLDDLIPDGNRVLVTYGGGSIKENGVYEQVRAALADRFVVDFGGIEPNPEYETLLRAARLAREERVDFVVAAGGGSVLDGTKFIAAAACFDEGEPWRILETRGAAVKRALPFGSVLTLPATGSEANPNAVISRREWKVKKVFGAETVFPRFSILDPETTYSLPPRQIRNGIVDAFVHVMEQYATYPAKAPLQDRQAEAVLATLVEQAPAIMADPPDYDARATFMWCATQALNRLLAMGVPLDWSTHAIGHELTALYSLDHGATLAVVLPGVLRHKIEAKRPKLEQYGDRIFGVNSAEEAIERTERFFLDTGMSTKLSDYDIDAAEAAKIVSRRFEETDMRLGEHRDIDARAVARILKDRA